MSRKESEEFNNFVGLVRSPVKRTPRGYAPAPAGERSLSGATTARMSVGSVLSREGSVRSVSSSTSTASEARQRRKVLQPLAGNNMFDNSVHSGTAHTPCSASPLDMMSSTISSNKRAVEARRSSLSVSRTLKLSPAVDTTWQQESEGGSRPYSEAGDHTRHSITQSALFSTLDRLPTTPLGGVSPPNQSKKLSPHQDLPLTPRAALGETDFLGSGDISHIDEGRSGVWSDCSCDAVFSPDPATPRVAHGGSDGRGDAGSNGIDGGGDRGASVRSEQAPATEVSPTTREEGHSTPAAEMAMRASSSTAIINGHPSSATAFACTPAAVSALLRMGGRSVGTVPTPDSVTADASRYRGYLASSPIATSGATGKDCNKGGGGVGVPNTPAVAATLAAMMMGNVHGSETAAMSGQEEGEEEVRSFAEETRRDEDAKSALTGVQVQQPEQPTPETPFRRGDNMSARLPIITPNRRKAASQLLDLSKATPRRMIRGYLGGGNTRFVPQVAKLVENDEEETPRTLLKGICGAQENPLGFAANRTRCNSTSVAVAAAAAAAAAAASTAAAAAASESGKAVGEGADGGGSGDASGALSHPTAQPPRVASSPAATAAVLHSSGLSAKGAGKTFLKIILVLILLVLLLGGALVVAKDVAVVVCLAFAGPAPTQPIY